jgi:hypothetical protein
MMETVTFQFRGMDIQLMKNFTKSQTGGGGARTAGAGNGNNGVLC